MFRVRQVDCNLKWCDSVNWHASDLSNCSIFSSTDAEQSLQCWTKFGKLYTVIHNSKCCFDQLYKNLLLNIFMLAFICNFVILGVGGTRRSGSSQALADSYGKINKFQGRSPIGNMSNGQHGLRNQQEV